MTPTKCEICGRELDSSVQWILLNRFVISASEDSGHIFSSQVNSNSQYLWNPKRNMATGASLCVKDCLTKYLEYRILEANVLVKDDGPQQ